MHAPHDKLGRENEFHMSTEHKRRIIELDTHFVL